jgi:hypothetical protein
VLSDAVAHDHENLRANEIDFVANAVLGPVLPCGATMTLFHDDFVPKRPEPGPMSNESWPPGIDTGTSPARTPPLPFPGSCAAWLPGYVAAAYQALDELLIRVVWVLTC